MKTVGTNATTVSNTTTPIVSSNAASSFSKLL